RDIRIVRTREAIAHEESGIGVLTADALIIADLAIDGIGPGDDLTARMGAERRVRRVEARLDGGRLAANALGSRKTLFMAREDRHHLDERFDVEIILGIVGVTEAKRIAELAHAMLDLNARIHLHKEMTRATHDALECARAIE